ncbi:MAG: sulfatase-like hydrolase/transferase, partial [Myxococcales bacterium]|nr:sulfatase-like hydrolase/transferase [Myxococcales bacterium]
MRSGKIAWVARVRGSGVALICALTATSCSEAPEESAAGSPSVILVVMDTVRADHLPCYGYARPTTPNLCGFAERADRYENAFASAPWTLPSHASMFTGRLP